MCRIPSVIPVPELHRNVLTSQFKIELLHASFYWSSRTSPMVVYRPICGYSIVVYKSYHTETACAVYPKGGKSTKKTPVSAFVEKDVLKYLHICIDFA